MNKLLYLEEKDKLANQIYWAFLASFAFCILWLSLFALGTFSTIFEAEMLGLASSAVFLIGFLWGLYTSVFFWIACLLRLWDLEIKNPSRVTSQNS